MEQDLSALLIDIAQNRNRNAFSKLFLNIAPRLKSFLVKGGLSAHNAEEVVQETMLVVWDRAEKFNSTKASASTWIYTIARNKKIDFLRKQGRSPLASTDLWPDIEDESSQIDDQSDLNRESVRNLISELPFDQRQVVYKTFFESKSQSEIAADLDVPLGTVKSRLRLAMKKFEVLTSASVLCITILVTKFF